MANNQKHKKSSGSFEIERLDPKNSRWYSKKLINEHITRYKLAARYCKGKIVVDMGCGTGYGSKLISDNGADKVYAYDIDSSAIEYARKNYLTDKIQYNTSSADDLKISASSIDVVICFEVIEHLKKPDKLIMEVLRILKPGGIYIMSTPNKLSSFGDNPYHIREFTYRELIDILRQFSHIQIFGQRKLNFTIIKLYKLLHKNIPIPFFRFLLKMRPWENYKIEKLTKKTNPPYLYLVAMCKK